MQQQFAPVVYLLSTTGNILRRLHAAEARRIAPQCLVTRTRAGRIRELTQLTLTTTPAVEQAWPHTGKPPRAPSELRLTCYMGQRYTRLVALRNAAGDYDHRCQEFKHIHPDDAPLFRLSVTDNLNAQ